MAADLTGKVELGIAEDDPRNPAVIADNVGDNVGDVAGMGADLFDSNVAAMASALVIAQSLSGGAFANTSMVFCYAILGLLASVVGIATARVGKNGNPTRALNSSTYVTTAIFLALTACATLLFEGFSWRIWGASAVGLLVGVIIGIATDYFTDDSKPIVRKVAHASGSGPAFTILSGVSYGFISALPAMLGIAVSALVAYKALRADGRRLRHFRHFDGGRRHKLSIVGMIISNDAYGPIVDNARGLAEMGDLGEETIRTADELDSAGNTVKAVTKGFSISAAGLTVISLLGAFMSEANAALAEAGKALITGFDIMSPTVFFGILIGAAIPAVFSAMLILGVDKNAQRSGCRDTPAVCFDPGPEGRPRGREAGVRQVHRHRHHGRAPRADSGRSDEHRRHAGRRVHRRSAGHRWVPAGEHRQRSAAGAVYVQLGRPVGQLEKVCGGRQRGRQGAARRISPPSSATPSATRSRIRQAVHQHADHGRVAGLVSAFVAVCPVLHF